MGRDRFRACRLVLCCLMNYSITQVMRVQKFSTLPVTVRSLTFSPKWCLTRKNSEPLSTYRLPSSFPHKDSRPLSVLSPSHQDSTSHELTYHTISTRAIYRWVGTSIIWHASLQHTLDFYRYTEVMVHRVQRCRHMLAIRMAMNQR